MTDEERSYTAAYDSWRSLALGERDGFAPFSFYLPVQKAVPQDDSKAGGQDQWIISGPLSEPGSDLEGESMSMKGLRSGLATFWKLGAPLDVDHRWERTGEWKYLIGKGIADFDAPHPGTGRIVPHLRAKLYQHKELARQAWEHMDDPDAVMGYSVAGGCIRKSGSKLLQPIITSVALTSRPIVAANSGTVQRVAKCLDEVLDQEDLDIRELRLPVEPEMMACLMPFPVAKALGIASGLEAKYTGTGLEALSVEDLDARRRKKKRRHRVGTPVSATVAKSLADRLYDLRELAAH